LEHKNKKTEAFCLDCKELICIECILEERHKQHDFVSLEKAIESEMRLMEDKSCEVTEVE